MPTLITKFDSEGIQPNHLEDKLKAQSQIKEINASAL